MIHIVRGILIGFLLALAGGAGAFTYYYVAGEGGGSSTTALPNKAPKFTLPDLDGRDRSSTEWEGKILIVNFWATWCAPCRKEVPLLIDAYKRYADRDVVVIGVAVDRAEPVKKFAAELKINYPILLATKTGFKLATAFGNRSNGIPYTVIVAPDGSLFDSHTGLLDQSDLDGWLEAIVPITARPAAQSPATP
ncbi:MAG: TlpA disulfide reductase family protein [Pseudomonadota bacterium]|nr:TlpA disulfide reductase family protein [Pseudomonadota bacterium]